MFCAGNTEMFLCIWHWRCSFQSGAEVLAYRSEVTCHLTLPKKNQKGNLHELVIHTCVNVCLCVCICVCVKMIIKLCLWGCCISAENGYRSHSLHFRLCQIVYSNTMSQFVANIDSCVNEALKNHTYCFMPA